MRVALVLLIAVVALVKAGPLTKKGGKPSLKRLDGVHPDDIWEIGGQDFYISSFKTDFATATLICNDMGLTLASLETPEKNMAMQSFIHEYEISVGIDYWTSGVRVDKEGLGQYQWTNNGQMVVFEDFSGPPYYPDLADACIELNVIADWKVMDCNNQYRFICEWPAA